MQFSSRPTSSSRNLYDGDPLALLLFRLLGTSSLRVWILAVLTYGVLYVGLGWLLSDYYQQMGYSLLAVYDQRQLTPLLFTALIVVPIVWVSYMREPIKFAEMFDALYANGVFDQRGATYEVLVQFVQDKLSVFKRPRYLVFVLTFLVFMLSVWLWQTSGQQDPLLYGYTHSWWAIDPYYFWIVWLPLSFVNLYMVLWIIVRRIVSVSVTNELLDSVEVRLLPFHPDKANGMFPVGRYNLGIAPPLVLAGFYTVQFIVYPVLWGGAPNLKLDTALYLLLYLATVLAVLVIPVWGTHVFMERKKASALDVVAREIQAQLAHKSSENVRSEARVYPSCESEKIVELVSQIEALEKKYRIMEKEYHTWPFNTSSLTRFFIAVSSPLLTAVISIAVNSLES